MISTRTNLEFYDGYRTNNVGEVILRRDWRSKHRHKRRLRHGFDVIQPDIPDGADKSLIRVKLEIVKVVHFLADDEFSSGAKLLPEHRMSAVENPRLVDDERSPTLMSVPKPTYRHPLCWLTHEKRESMSLNLSVSIWTAFLLCGIFPSVVVCQGPPRKRAGWAPADLINTP